MGGGKREVVGYKWFDGVMRKGRKGKGGICLIIVLKID